MEIERAKIESLETPGFYLFLLYSNNNDEAIIITPLLAHREPGNLLSPNLLV